MPAPLREQADKALESLKLPPPPAPLSGADLAGGQLKHPAEVSDIETTHFVLSLQQHSGCISQLRNKHTGREWCGIDNPLGLFSYQTLSKEDYDRFIASYIAVSYTHLSSVRVWRVSATSWLETGSTSRTPSVDCTVSAVMQDIP